MTEFTKLVEIDGHKVPSSIVDLFFSGKNGERITDDEWDESKRRIAEMEAIDTDPDNPVVTWELVNE